MCFSAGASFGAGAVLIGAGIFAIAKIDSPKKIPFACVPIIFGLQQLSEGMLWLSFTHPNFASWEVLTTYLFLIFAQVVWPIWLPFSIWAMEPNKARKKIMFYLIWVGVLISGHLTYSLFAGGVSAVIEAHHIKYDLFFPSMNIHRIFYFFATVVPLFLSSLKWMKLVAGALLGSVILSYIFYAGVALSVWCFFAAILSLLVFWVLYSNKDLTEAPS